VPPAATPLRTALAQLARRHFRRRRRRRRRYRPPLVDASVLTALHHNSAHAQVVEKVQLPGPPQPGPYELDVFLMCDSYVDCDVHEKVKFQVHSSASLPVYKAHEEDAALDEEMTLFETVLDGAGASDSDEDDDGSNSGDSDSDWDDTNSLLTDAQKAKRKEKRRKQKEKEKALEGDASGDSDEEKE